MTAVRIAITELGDDEVLYDVSQELIPNFTVATVDFGGIPLLRVHENLECDPVIQFSPEVLEPFLEQVQRIAVELLLLDHQIADPLASLISRTIALAFGCLCPPNAINGVPVTYPQSVRCPVHGEGGS